MIGQLVEISNVLPRDDESMAVAQRKWIEQDRDVVVLKHGPARTLACEHCTRPAWFPKIGDCHGL